MPEETPVRTESYEPPPLSRIDRLLDGLEIGEYDDYYSKGRKYLVVRLR